MKNKSLYIQWEDKESGKFFIIGKIIKLSYGYLFKYMPDFNIAKEIGCMGFVPFDDVNKIYFNEKLFPIFSSRIPNKNRSDINDILKKYNIDNYDEFSLLEKSKLPIDNYKFINIDGILNIFFKG